MFNTLINTNNITSIIYLTKYSVLHTLFILGHMRLQHETLTIKGDFSVLITSGQYDITIGIGYIYKV